MANSKGGTVSENLIESGELMAVVTDKTGNSWGSLENTAVKCKEVFCSDLQCSAVQFITVQCSEVQCNRIQHI